MKYSLSCLTRWLSEQAESLEVDIFPYTAASGLLIKDGHAVGVYTSDKGVDAEGKPKDNYQRGYAIHGKSLILAEGALGSVTEEAVQQFHLAPNNTQTYGLGIKEVWEIPGCESMMGHIIHTLGYPLQRSFHDRLLDL